MTSPTAAALSAANQITSTGPGALAQVFLTWIGEQASPALAAQALESVERTTKNPQRMLVNAAAALEQITAAADDSSGGGSSSAWTDHGPVSGTVAIDSSVGTHVLALMGDTELTADAPDPTKFVELAFWVTPAGSALTVFGVDVTLADPGLIVALGIQGSWNVIAPSSGGSSGGGGGGGLTWSQIVSDPFTGADGTALGGRTVNGATWVDDEAGIVLDANRAEYPTHANNASSHLPLPGGGSAEHLRITADYLLDLKAASGSTPLLRLGTDYHSTQYGNTQNVRVTLEANASSFDDATTFTSTLSVQGGGSDAFAVTAVGGADLTAQPGHGTLQIAFDGEAMSISVNGTEVATATVPGTLQGTIVAVYMSNRYPRIDNLVVETAA